MDVEALVEAPFLKNGENGHVESPPRERSSPAGNSVPNLSRVASSSSKPPHRSPSPSSEPPRHSSRHRRDSDRPRDRDDRDRDSPRIMREDDYRSHSRSRHRD